MEQYQKNILEFNKQLQFKGLEEYNLNLLKKYPLPDGIVIIGMGGSGLPGTLLQGLAKYIALYIPVIVWKDYELPQINFQNPLCVFISFSGNTEETLSGLKQVLGHKNKKAIAIITSGGKLKNLAERFKLPLISFDADDLTPRQALGRMYYSLNKILQVRFPSIKSSILSEKIKPRNLEKAGKNLAKKLTADRRTRIPLIYTDSNHSYLGYVWKTNLNETAKIPAFTNALPEMDHNEITGFEHRPYPFFALFLSDDKTSNQVKRKINLTKKVLKINGVPAEVIKLSGKNDEERSWNSIILSHWVSFHLAKINKINPTQTRLIDQLKKLGAK